MYNGPLIMKLKKPFKFVNDISYMMRIIVVFYFKGWSTHVAKMFSLKQYFMAYKIIL